MGVFGARALGLFLCVRLTLTYLRHNLPQELLAEVHGVRRATASPPLIASALREHVPTVEDLDGPADHRRRPSSVLVLEGPPRVWPKASTGPSG